MTGWWRLVWRLQLDTTEDREEAGLVLAAPGSSQHQVWSWRTENRGDAPLTYLVPDWPVVLESGDVYVCSANISYHLPDTTTDIQEGYKSKLNLFFKTENTKILIFIIVGLLLIIAA